MIKAVIDFTKNSMSELVISVRLPGREESSQGNMQLVSRLVEVESEMSRQTILTQSSGVFTLHQERESDSSSEFSIVATTYND